MLNNSIKNLLLVNIILILSLLTISCSNNNSKKIELLIFAPASMSDVLPKISKNFYNKDINIIFDFGGSAILASKISNGAPADIYISAGTSTYSTLENNNLLYKPKQTIVKNNLVVVTTKDLENIKTIYDFKENSISRIAIANPDFAPAGKYAIESLKNLDLWKNIKEKVVLGADVRSTLNYVLTENSDLAIVYFSDTIFTDLKPLDIIPSDSYSEILYPASIIKNSKHPEHSEQFIQHLISLSSQKTFEKYGFDPIIDIKSSN
tara:strand:+ start:5760 stop:6551 length:792 start_codon:yes stop_codon:yes gene_type:complete